MRITSKIAKFMVESVRKLKVKTEEMAPARGFSGADKCVHFSVDNEIYRAYGTVTAIFGPQGFWKERTPEYCMLYLGEVRSILERAGEDFANEILRLKALEVEDHIIGAISEVKTEITKLRDELFQGFLAAGGKISRRAYKQAPKVNRVELVTEVKFAMEDSNNATR